jgi:hypothetical protein
VPYWEWNALAGPPAKEAYLLRALQQLEEQMQEQLEEVAPPEESLPAPLKSSYPVDEGLR